MFGGQIRGRRARRPLAFEIEQFHRELHAADAVGDGVMELVHETGGTTAKPFHHRDFPERTGPVEGRRRFDPRDVDDRIGVTRRRRGEPAQMPVEVDLVVRVHRGVASRSGGTCTTWCIPGIMRLARSTTAFSASRSGARSRNPTDTTVERSSGSRSMYQLNASDGRMCVSTATVLLATTAPPRCAPNAPIDARTGPPARVGTKDTNASSARTTRAAHSYTSRFGRNGRHSPKIRQLPNTHGDALRASETRGFSAMAARLASQPRRFLTSAIAFVLLAATVLVGLVQGAQNAHAALPSGFSDAVVISGLNNPTQLDSPPTARSSSRRRAARSGRTRASPTRTRSSWRT